MKIFQQGSGNKRRQVRCRDPKAATCYLFSAGWGEKWSFFGKELVQGTQRGMNVIFSSNHYSLKKRFMAVSMESISFSDSSDVLSLRWLLSAIIYFAKGRNMNYTTIHISTQSPSIWHSMKPSQSPWSLCSRHRVGKDSSHIRDTIVSKILFISFPRLFISLQSFLNWLVKSKSSTG